MNIPLASGFTLSASYSDKDDPDCATIIDWIAVYDASGNQVDYLELADWFHRPRAFRQRLYTFLRTAGGGN